MLYLSLLSAGHMDLYESGYFMLSCSFNMKVAI
jgi:hypothetical protein